MGAFDPCPYLTSKQLFYIRRRIVERTLRCSPTIHHLFDFRLVIQETNYNQVYVLVYLSTFEESKAEILLSLCEPDIFLQYALDLVPVPILPLTYVNVNNYGISETNTITTNSERIFNVVGYGSTLQEAKMQLVLTCEYIKQHFNIDDLLFKSDVEAEAIEW
ncbi:unnamed protein product [Rotaria sp. Silwood1]|nr:unnamed protein product [Rotaria sp. Silwood1]CAF1561898.1 unnamed protein product [Rotaria sp. Silwood1]CAF3697091.1 unnamed protein product [Rotaria sp. Silwood1]CAF4961587.1 unnamed protein product [Rotaria sp. Silwood1]CAF5075257.1 unnamed protein product [Rotaria sp. Silwood1]